MLLMALCSGIDINVNTKFLALADNIVDLIIAEIQTVSVFRGPAAGAVQIAGTGWIQQDCPGNVIDTDVR